MSTSIRNNDTIKVDAAIVVLNAHRLDLLKLKAGTIFHADTIPATAIATADASDLATCVTLANAIKAFYNLHAASACSATTGQGAHIAVGTANATAAATDLTTVQALANGLKTTYEAHRVLTTLHATADATNTISAATATDLATSITMLNELKLDINAHVAAALASNALRVVAA